MLALNNTRVQPIFLLRHHQQDREGSPEAGLGGAEESGPPAHQVAGQQADHHGVEDTGRSPLYAELDSPVEALRRRDPTGVMAFKGICTAVDWVVSP